MNTIVIPRESRAGETRVAATPETVARMVVAGFGVSVEAGAGERAFLSDERYHEAGAAIVAPAGLRAAWGAADVVLKVAPMGANDRLGGDEAAALRPGATVIGFFAAHRNLPTLRTLAVRKASALAMELVPRITRAQKMDALSSQASIAGYRAVLLAASRLPKYVPLMMTAAGTTPPAKFVIMGAGVAGLQAVATAKRLGAVVWVSDVRPAVKEQVESLGGKFIDLPQADSGDGQGGYAREMDADFLVRQQAIIGEHVTTADAVITTALIPGRPAPRLLPARMVRRMRAGAVVIDLAAEEGGNCELTQVGREVVEAGVTILGEANLAATMPLDASTLYAQNVVELLLHVAPEGRLELERDDEIARATLLMHNGTITHAPTAGRLASAETAEEAAK
jgi:NAD(P) transhydrogenase subunit alpha